MTRINCVPVEELSGKHLIAEYREIPRVFNLAAGAAKRGGFQPVDSYRLGVGHVKFFYTRLGYCTLRFHQLISEMQKRGYKTSHTECPEFGPVPDSWLSNWEPDDEAIELNRQRIRDRSGWST